MNFKLLSCDCDLLATYGTWHRHKQQEQEAKSKKSKSKSKRPISQLPVGTSRACSLFERAPYKQQAVETQSIKCQIKTEPSSWTTAAATFFLPCERQISTHLVALASTSFSIQPSCCSLAVVLFRALRGIQSPAGEKTKISLL
jgi:hypothetical protein